MADNGESMGPGSKNEDPPAEAIDDEADEREFRGVTHKFHVSSEATKEFDRYRDCPACSAITARGDRTGRLGCNRPDECRKQMLEEM